ncbi:Cell cycle checkpoint protein RAD1 [Teratosphaeria destructans]|uniref:Cell cycle checkpoint protein RAD1 n=1 Tax=Teratosphaeria destructans TaxID=418781 RepID=A0A9W7SQ98_9PEZI|nr:Cell cycle checkpoint protein RAD1 [Teratosphaeria destructans]
MAPPHLFSATSSSARQLLILLRCISFAKTAQVRISPEGIRFTTEDGSFIEAFVFLDKSLFASYTYHAPPPPSSQDDPPDPPIFEISLDALLETLNIFSLSDPHAARRPGDHDSFAAHRLHRHAGINAFSNPTLGVSGVCTFTYQGEGQPLTIYMSDAGVTTTCDLTTYEAEGTEEIPFARDAVAVKTIMRSNALLDAIAELSSLNPEILTITASPSSRPGADLSLSASGALGSATVEFQADGAGDTPILETHQCGAKTAASFKFALVKAAQRAMASATKVSVRLDREGVLSLQFLVEVEGGGAGGGEGVVFVDFRVVPLVDGEDGDEEGSSSGED